jgi:tRNA dimethylallyltransferase
VSPAPEAHGAGLVLGLLGPTAVGKTAVAVALADALGVRVISCDSMQVYRGFPLLTNQAAVQELSGVTQELVGFVDAAESFSAADYAALARPLVNADVAAAGFAVVAGGTGLYMRAALGPLRVGATNPGLRLQLEARAATEGGSALHAELTRLDPAAAEAIDPRNTRRVVRALEAVMAGGEGWSGRDDLWDPSYDHPTVVVGLTLSSDALYGRIASRVERMMTLGAVDEVRRFREQRGREVTAPSAAGVCSAIGYREICGYLDGVLTLGEATDQVAAATRRYARRQMTWLRKVKGAVIIDVQDRRPEEIVREILDRALADPSAKESRSR